MTYSIFKFDATMVKRMDNIETKLETIEGLLQRLLTLQTPQTHAASTTGINVTSPDAGKPSGSEQDRRHSQGKKMQTVQDDEDEDEDGDANDDDDDEEVEHEIYDDHEVSDMHTAVPYTA